MVPRKRAGSAKATTPVVAAPANEKTSLPAHFDPDKVYRVGIARQLKHGSLVMRPSSKIQMRGDVAEKFRDDLLWAEPL